MPAFLAEAKRLLADIAQLQKPTLALAVAGVAAPILASILGAAITPAEVSGELLLVGGAAATVERLLNKPAPAPVVPPAPPAPPAAK